MRVAIYNSFSGQELAETGLSRRIHMAAGKLGWEAAEVGSSSEVNDLDPDFVLALHFFTPKLTSHPTYGCMWSPPSFFQENPQYVSNVLSYDSYLSSSAVVDQWLRRKLDGTGKNYFITRFFTSCHQIPWEGPNLSNPRLLYAGTNWDGPRFQELFQELDAQPYIDIYGSRAGWRYIKRSYRGILPFDGSSILTALRSAGAGLCLHKREHCTAATPSLRIFEIAASGAIAICQEHPFIRDNFGDAVLYLDSALEPGSTVKQISEYMMWIRNNPEKALALSKRAYDIFAAHFAFEHLLSGVARFHDDFLRSNLPARSYSVSVPPQKVQIIMRMDCPFSELAARNALESVIDQCDPAISVILLGDPESTELQQLFQGYSEKIATQIVACSATSLPSTRLWAGLNAVTAPYFGILNPNQVFYPGHVGTLLRRLQNSDTHGLAYSGAIVRSNEFSQVARGQPFMQRSTEKADLHYFGALEDASLRSVHFHVAPGSFLANSSLIHKKCDPQLTMAEELFLLLDFLQRTGAQFSYCASTELQQIPRHRIAQREWNQNQERMRMILGKQIGSLHLHEYNKAKPGSRQPRTWLRMMRHMRRMLGT